MIISEEKRINLLFMVFSLLTLFASITQAQEPAKTTGTVCISTVPKPNADPVSLGNPVGGSRSFNYTIVIDGQKATASTERSVAIKNLALHKTHLLKILRDGKQVESFRFSFRQEGATRLCLWYKSLYETWSLWPGKNKNKCGCT
jgi:hypothetical protein